MSSCVRFPWSRCNRGDATPNAALPKGATLGVLLMLSFAVPTAAAQAQKKPAKAPPRAAPIVSPSAVPVAPPQADLQVVSFEFVEWGKCPGPGSGAFPTFRVRVRNGGTAPSRAGILIRVTDEHYPAWTHSQGLQSLGIGVEAQQLVVLSPPSDRAHADAAAPHAFVAVVDPDHTVVDPNPRNNRSAALSVGRPCT